MPRTFSVADYRNSVYRGNIARIWTRNHDTTIIKDRSFLSLSLSKLILSPLSHLRPVMFLFMVHDSKLPPGSILFRTRYLSYPVTRTHCFLWWLHVPIAHGMPSLFHSFFVRLCSFYSHETRCLYCVKNALLKHIIVVYSLWIRENRNMASLIVIKALYIRCIKLLSET